MLTAYLFGIDRFLDYVDVLNSLFIISTFLFFDAIEMTTMRRASESNSNKTSIFSEILSATFVLSLSTVCLVGVSLTYILPIYAPGFSAAELPAIENCFLFMLPYSLSFLTFQALQSIQRVQGKHQNAFFSELVAAVFTLLFLATPSYSIVHVPLSLGIGQAAGILFLIWLSRDVLSLRSIRFHKATWICLWETLKPAIPLNLVHLIYLLAEKRVGSLSEPGTLSAFAYATIIFSAAFSLPGFSQVFLPRLATKEGRRNLLHLIKIVSIYGLLLAGFLVSQAREIVSLLFERGSMSSGEAASIALLLQVMCLRLIFEYIGQLCFKSLWFEGKLRNVLVHRALVHTICLLVLSTTDVMPFPTMIAVLFVIDGLAVFLLDLVVCRKVLAFSYKQFSYAIAPAAGLACLAILCSWFVTILLNLDGQPSLWAAVACNGCVVLLIKYKYTSLFKNVTES